jgi:hypothetical protein
MSEYDLKIIALEASQTNEELQDMAYKLRQALQAEGPEAEGFFMTISGYDDDSRELWEIPEAIDLCERVIKTGLISLLNLSSRVKELMPERFQHIDEPGPGIGALEVWVFAKGKMSHEGAKVYEKDLDEFYNTMSAANITLNKLFTDRN